MRGQRIAVVEVLAGAQVEGPGQPVLGHDPALGNARSHTALLEIEADEAVIHGGLVDGVARASFEDRIEGLGRERLNGENQSAFLLLGRTGCNGRDERAARQAEARRGGGTTSSVPPQFAFS